MHLLLCYDESKAAQAALEAALAKAKMLEAKVYILTSMAGGPEVPKEDFEHAQTALDRIQRRFEREGIACETNLSVRGVEPGEDLVQFAGENSIDEIVIGVKRRSKVGKLLFGSTAQYVILEAPCPVLTVKAAEAT